MSTIAMSTIAMSTIATIYSSPRDALASLVRSSNSTASTTNSSVQSIPETAEKASDDRAANVVLSKKAKAIMARNKTDQIVADRLDAELAAARGNESPSEKSAAKSSSKVVNIFEEKSSSPTSDQAKEIKWQAGAPYGDASLSDEEFIKKARLKDGLTLQADAFEFLGKSPEAVANLRAAAAGADFTFQKASDVPDLNFKSNKTFTPNGAGGWDVGGGTTTMATGATKEAIDSGRALAMWSADRGDVYVSW